VPCLRPTERKNNYTDIGFASIPVNVGKFFGYYGSAETYIGRDT